MSGPVAAGPGRRSADPRVEVVRFPVAGMTCSSCAGRITRALKNVDGVSRVRVDLGRETATVHRSVGLVTDEALEAAVASAGYRADLTAVVPITSGDDRGLLARLLGRAS